MENVGLERITRMLEMAHTDERVFPATDLYNEGWMLRILLAAQSEGTQCFPFPFLPGARWFSEARIASPFLARKREDSAAEGYTRIDGVIGHFGFRHGTKTGLTLAPDARQLVVIEAKMGSRLSARTKNAKDHDQAARIVACIAWTISQSDRPVNSLQSLGFYIFAPEEKITGGVFKVQLDKASINKKVEDRINGYSGEKYDILQTWYREFFIPTLDRIGLFRESWESVLKRVGDPAIDRFYARCCEFNGLDGLQPRQRKRNDSKQSI